MSDALVDLFNSPPGPPPRLRTRSLSASPGPSRRATNQPDLFLSPGSAIDTPAKRRRASPTRDRDEYDDLDPWDLAEEIPELPAPIRENRITARDTAGGLEANGGYELDLDPFAALREAADQAGTNGEAIPGEKKKRVMPKIDAERLMDENGFPALMRAAKRFTSRGKGHEAQDLKDLLGVYQIWAHKMFPKGDFMGTISRVENVCRSRRMESAIKGYRDAFYPPPRSPTPKSPIESLSSPPGLAAPVESASSTNGNGGRTNTRSAEPLFSQADEEVDMDDLMALEEMEREEAVSRGPTTTTTGPADDIPPPALEEEDEWEGLYD